MRLISLHQETRNAARVGFGWQVCPVDCDALEILGGYIVTHSWSPIVWRDGLRHQSAFQFADFLALDFDGDGMTLREAQRAFADCRHVIGVTKSHGKAKGNKPPADRFRVVMPFERRITSLAEYRYTVSRYAKRYDADELCVDGARFFFPCQNTVGLPVTEGFEQDVYEPPPPEPPPDYSAYRDGSAGSMPRWCEGLLRFGCPDLKRNTTCFRLGLHLSLCGYTTDAIVDLIMASPIPIGPHVRDEVLEAVANGAKRAKEELSGSAQEGQENNAGASRGRPRRPADRQA